MPNRIDLSLPVDPTSQSGGEGNDQDTAVDPTPQDLENLQIGPYLIPDVVRRLGVVLGYDLHISKLLTQGPERTRILLEQGPASNSTASSKEQLIYNITDGGGMNTREIRDPRTTHRQRDNMFIKFRTNFSKAPSVIVGLNYLDASRKGGIRIFVGADNIHAHLFNLYGSAWLDTILFGAGCTWLAVPSYEHPLLQVGSLILDGGRKDLKHQAITFRSPYKSPPKVVVWLNKMDCDKINNTRVMVFVTDVTSKGFKAHINTWGGSVLYSGGLSWFAYPLDTPGICSGDLLPTQGTLGVVTFDKPFARPPRRVLVALNKLDTDKGSNCRFKIVHEAVSERGMGVRIETWDDTILNTAGVSYIAME